MLTQQLSYRRGTILAYSPLVLAHLLASISFAFRGDVFAAGLQLIGGAAIAAVGVLDTTSSRVGEIANP